MRPEFFPPRFRCHRFYKAGQSTEVRRVQDAKSRLRASPCDLTRGLAQHCGLACGLKKPLRELGVKWPMDTWHGFPEPSVALARKKDSRGEITGFERHVVETRCFLETLTYREEPLTHSSENADRKTQPPGRRSGRSSGRTSISSDGASALGCRPEDERIHCDRRESTDSSAPTNPSEAEEQSTLAETEMCLVAAFEGGTPVQETTNDEIRSEFSNKASILDVFQELTPDSTFDNKYTILPQRAGLHFNIHFAQLVLHASETHVLKFYSNQAHFKRSKKMHQRLRRSKHVCTMIDAVQKHARYPPYIILEAGIYTLERWLRIKNRSVQEKMCSLQHVLLGLYELHCKKIVHCHISSSNVVFCGKQGVWKLIDFDEAEEVGGSGLVNFEVCSAPPEALQCCQSRHSNFKIATSTDMWQFGVLMFEVLTEHLLYGDEVTCDEATAFLKSDRLGRRLDLVGNDYCRHLIGGLLLLDAEKRLSAVQLVEGKALCSAFHR